MYSVKKVSCKPFTQFTKKRMRVESTGIGTGNHTIVVLWYGS